MPMTTRLRSGAIKRRNYRKLAGLTRKPRLSKPVAKAVRVIAKRAVSRTEETKHACKTIENQVGHNSAIGSADAVALIPSIGQGGDDYQRIGNKISPKGLYLKGRLGLSYNSQGNNRPIYVRVMVLSQKNVKDSSQIPSSFSYDNLLKANDVSASATGNVAYDGTPRNSMYPVNDDLFVVHYKRDFLMTPSLANGTDSGIESNPKGIRKFGCKVAIPKALTYLSATATVPQNSAPFVVVGYCYADGTSPDTTTTRLTSTMVSTLYFKDA